MKILYHTIKQYILVHTKYSPKSLKKIEDRYVELLDGHFDQEVLFPVLKRLDDLAEKLSSTSHSD